MESTTSTVHTAADIALRLQPREVSLGYITPSLAFGADYIRTFPKMQMAIG